MGRFIPCKSREGRLQCPSWAYLAIVLRHKVLVMVELGRWR